MYAECKRFTCRNFEKRIIACFYPKFHYFTKGAHIHSTVGCDPEWDRPTFAADTLQFFDFESG